LLAFCCIPAFGCDGSAIRPWFCRYGGIGSVFRRQIDAPGRFPVEKPVRVDY